MMTATAMCVGVSVMGFFGGEPPAGGGAKVERPEALVTSEALMAHVRAMPVKRAARGDEESREGLRATEKLIAEKLRGWGYEPVLDPVDYIGGGRGGKSADPAAEKPAPWNNIIVEIAGKGAPQVVGEVLVFSAHIDAVARSPGADDDASGVAAILEAARILKDRPMQRTVRLVFFNLEEVGLVGSRAYVDRNAEKWVEGDSGEAPKEKIVGMVSCDMLGFYSTAPESQKSPIPPMGNFKPPSVGDFIGMGGVLMHRTFSQALDGAMKASSPELKTVVVDFLPIAPPDLLRSDHAPFLARGIPAVILSTTADFRNPHYHQPTDTIETLDAKMFTTTAKGVIGAIHRLAGPVGEPLIELGVKKEEK